MIKRIYYMSVRKLHGDGMGSYSFSHGMAICVSWLPDAKRVFEESYEYHKEALKDKPGEAFEITIFSRLQ